MRLFSYRACLVVMLFACSCATTPRSSAPPPNPVVGAKRVVIEDHLGMASQSVTLENGDRMDTYEIEEGPEVGILTAIVTGSLDIVSAGLLQTRTVKRRRPKHSVRITYGPDGIAKSVEQ